MNAMSRPSTPLMMMGVISRYLACTQMNTRLSIARTVAATTVSAGCQWRAAGTISPIVQTSSIYGVVGNIPLGIWELGVTLGLLGIWGFCYLSFMDAFPRIRVLLMTSPYREEVQVPVDPRTMEPLPAHE